MLVMPETTDPHRVEQLRAVTEVVLLGRDWVDLAALLNGWPIRATCEP